MSFDRFIPYAHHVIDEDDRKAVSKVLEDAAEPTLQGIGGKLTQGPLVRQFEKALAEKVGARHVVAVSSGTAALWCAARLWKEYRGVEEIVVPTLTFVATANAMRAAGLKVKLCDVEQTGYSTVWSSMPDKVDVEFAGLMQAHYGNTIIDAAHSLGAESPRGPVGSLNSSYHSMLTCFSFHPSKLITTGEGGAICTASHVEAEALRALRDNGRSVDGQCVFEGAHNLRMGEMNAALGLSQLKKMDRFLARRREIASLYDEAFKERENFEPMLLPSSPSSLNARHLYVILVKNPDKRDEYRRKLEEKGIGTQVHYKPVHLQPAYFQTGVRFPVAEDLWLRSISLPMWPMSDEQVGRVVETVLGVIG